jgi:tetratricopeptide (TPR) repeat protein
MRLKIKNKTILWPAFVLVFSFLGGLGVFTAAQENLGKGRVSGTVVDESGVPLEGVQIVVQSLRSKTSLDGKSDKKGRFAVAGMGSGMWRITASKDGFASLSVDQNVSQIAANPPIELTLKKVTGMAAFSSDKDAQKVFDQGNVLLNQDNYDEALTAFEQFLAKYPEIYQVHLNIGTCYLKKGDLDKAEGEFKLVLDKVMAAQGDYKKDTASSVRALSGLGEIAVRKGDFETAKKNFSQALEISPQDQAAAYNVGEIFFSNQQIDEAIKYLELATQIKKDWSKPYLRLGYVYLNKGDFTKSLECFNKFIELDPSSPDVPQVKNIIDTIEKMKK